MKFFHTHFKSGIVKQYSLICWQLFTDLNTSFNHNCNKENGIQLWSSWKDEMEQRMVLQS